MGSRRDEGQGIDELLGHERECEDHDGQDPGQRDRDDELQKGLEPGQPVHHRGVLQLGRDRLEEPHEQPGRKRDREARIDDDDRPQRVLEIEPRDDARQGDEEKRRRHQISQEDRDPDAAPPPSGQAGERIGGRHRQEQGDRHDDEARKGGVAEPAQEERLVDEKTEVLERRLLVEDERVVPQIVKIAGPLEARDQHPVEGEGEQDGEDGEHRPVERPECQLARADAGHHTTSARCADRSISQATATSSGTRKIEMAAPSARSLPRIPVKKASEGSTCVVS